MHLSMTPRAFRRLMSAGSSCETNAVYSAPVPGVSQPKILTVSPFFSATTLGANSAPHCEKRWDISKYFIPHSPAIFIHLSRRSKPNSQSFYVIFTDIS